jgi:hypothetical protein
MAFNKCTICVRLVSVALALAMVVSMSTIEVRRAAPVYEAGIARTNRMRLRHAQAQADEASAILRDANAGLSVNHGLVSNVSHLPRFRSTSMDGRTTELHAKLSAFTSLQAHLDAPPVIHRVVPAAVPLDGGVMLKVLGNNFAHVDGINHIDDVYKCYFRVIAPAPSLVHTEDGATQVNGPTSAQPSIPPNITNNSYMRQAEPTRPPFAIPSPIHAHKKHHHHTPVLKRLSGKLKTLVHAGKDRLSHTVKGRAAKGFRELEEGDTGDTNDISVDAIYHADSGSVFCTAPPLQDIGASAGNYTHVEISVAVLPVNSTRPQHVVKWAHKLIYYGNHEQAQPILMSLTPARGPVSGGTIVAIHGRFMRGRDFACEFDGQSVAPMTPADLGFQAKEPVDHPVFIELDAGAGEEGVTARQLRRALAIAPLLHHADNHYVVDSHVGQLHMPYDPTSVRMGSVSEFIELEGNESEASPSSSSLPAMLTLVDDKPGNYFTDVMLCRVPPMKTVRGAPFIVNARIVTGDGSTSNSLTFRYYNELSFLNEAPVPRHAYMGNDIVVSFPMAASVFSSLQAQLSDYDVTAAAATLVSVNGIMCRFGERLVVQAVVDAGLPGIKCMLPPAVYLRDAGPRRTKPIYVKTCEDAAQSLIGDADLVDGAGFIRALLSERLFDAAAIRKSIATLVQAAPPLGRFVDGDVDEAIYELQDDVMQQAGVTAPEAGEVSAPQQALLELGVGAHAAEPGLEMKRKHQLWPLHIKPHPPVPTSPHNTQSGSAQQPEVRAPVGDIGAAVSAGLPPVGPTNTPADNTVTSAPLRHSNVTGTEKVVDLPEEVIPLDDLARDVMALTTNVLAQLPSDCELQNGLLCGRVVYRSTAAYVAAYQLSNILQTSMHAAVIFRLRRLICENLRDVLRSACSGSTAHFAHACSTYRTLLVTKLPTCLGPCDQVDGSARPIKKAAKSHEMLEGPGRIFVYTDISANGHDWVNLDDPIVVHDPFYANVSDWRVNALPLQGASVGGTLVQIGPLPVDPVFGLPIAYSSQKPRCTFGGYSSGWSNRPRLQMAGNGAVERDGWQRQLHISSTDCVHSATIADRAGIQGCSHACTALYRSRRTLQHASFGLV